MQAGNAGSPLKLWPLLLALTLVNKLRTNANNHSLLHGWNWRYLSENTHTNTNTMPKEERVLCFKRELLEDIGLFQGLNVEVDKYLPSLTSPQNILYLNRSEAELDKRYKQLIPYVLVFCDGQILRYRRGKGGQETRLHGLFSVGVGGHISEEDHGLFSKQLGYEEGMRRELKEELDVQSSLDMPAMALINDDSTEVGYVHFGVVHVARIPSQKLVGHRSGILAPEFVPVAEAVEHLEAYESWSALCLANLDLFLSKDFRGKEISSLTARNS